MKNKTYNRDLLITAPFMVVALVELATHSITMFFYIYLVAVILFLTLTHKVRMKAFERPVPPLVRALFEFNAAYDGTKDMIYDMYFRPVVDEHLDSWSVYQNVIEEIREKIHAEVFSKLGFFPVEHWNYDGDNLEVNRYISSLVAGPLIDHIREYEKNRPE